MEDRITALEIKIAYLEDFLNKLQAIAVEQGEIVDTLKAENRVLKSKIKEILDNQEQDIPNRRPPHYWFQLWKAGKLCGEREPFFSIKRVLSLHTSLFPKRTTKELAALWTLGREVYFGYFDW